MGKKRQFRGKPNKFLTEDDKKNELFSKYYQGQFNWTDEQMTKFYSTMLAELPATFRVTGFREQSKEVQWLIKSRLLEGLVDGEECEEDKKTKTALAAPLQWYPGEMAWQLTASKMEIRKTPALRRLHSFLVSETECGFISRQEAVSMLPPLLLDVAPHHRVLDLCAAPGSKTAQLVEMLHAGAAPGTLPTGVVVASDIEGKRCYMMVHQLQRLQSPCVLVLRQDAAIFPRLRLPGDDQTGLLFDRVLADVPCSGDGTLRKNPDLWPRWSPLLGANEHHLQVRILRRALELLSVDGGRAVYSTCSLSPLEDEAVVAAVLGACGPAVRLVEIDLEARLPGLVSEPGLSSWSVMLRDGSWCHSRDQVPGNMRRSFRPSLFPPEGVAALRLDLCRRVLPQGQNTGGFFVALLEKVAPLPWMKGGAKEKPQEEDETKEEPQEEDEAKEELREEDETKEEPQEEVEIQSKEEELKEESQNGEVVTEVPQTIREGHMSRPDRGPPKKKARVFKEDPFFYVEDDDEAWLKLKQFYEIADSFPHGQLMYRSQEGKRRNYYFTNGLVKQIVQGNNEAGSSAHFVNLGVKVFGLSEDKAFRGYRVLQEGLESLEGYLGAARRLRLASRADLVTLLTYDNPLAGEFSQEVQEAFQAVSQGPVVMEYVPRSEDVVAGLLPRIRVVVAGWRGFSSLRHYAGVHERSHLLRLCGEEPAGVLVAPRWGEGALGAEEGDQEVMGDE